MSTFWEGRRVLVTGGGGFLGQAVLARLAVVGADSVIAPNSAEYDLRDRAATTALFGDTTPELVIHLAARVGGIGANQLHPSELYLDNLLMGTYVIDEALKRGTDKTVVVGTICSYPKFTPVPFSEDSLWTGYPEETNAPYGIAKLAQLVQLQSNRAQFGQNGIYLMPTNLYGPGDKFNSGVSHVIPALIKKCVEAVEAGADEIEVWGTGAASREFLYVDDAAEGIVLAAERYDGSGAGQPGRQPGDADPGTGRARRPGDRVRRRGALGRKQARRPAAAARGRLTRGRTGSGSRHPPSSPWAWPAPSSGTWSTGPRPRPARTEGAAGVVSVGGRGPAQADRSASSPARPASNQAAVRASPSSSDTTGRHPSTLAARSMSGRRLAGSSTGSSSRTSSEVEPVTFRTVSANSTTVCSSVDPMLTGPT